VPRRGEPERQKMPQEDTFWARSDVLSQGQPLTTSYGLLSGTRAVSEARMRNKVFGLRVVYRVISLYQERTSETVWKS
jgi:hypothetical protein